MTPFVVNTTTTLSENIDGGLAASKLTEGGDPTKVHHISSDRPIFYELLTA